MKSGEMKKKAPLVKGKLPDVTFKKKSFYNFLIKIETFTRTLIYK